MRCIPRLIPTLLLAFAAVLVPAGPAAAAKIADIANTKHNLSITGPGTVKSTTESQICVFCHTPHGAETIPNAPLWNRKLSSATYDATNTYRSSSIEASLTELAQGPGGLSRLCLSCHDGTMAIGSVNVANGKASQNLNLTGTGVGDTMPPGAGTATGFTRNLGTDLTNDHPISFTYDATVAAADGELRAPDGAVVGTRVRGTTKPHLPLENGQMQCTTCHDPHLRETDPLKGAAKFLRVNRFQELAPAGGAFSETNDIVCLACHDKGGQTWALSAHANPLVADELFNPAAAADREFPANLPVWRAACLSCHDTHTVQGARRLLREGTDSLAKPKSGGNSAIEETCYQCHSSTAETVLQTATNQVPNIKDDFRLPVHMPITSTDQPAGSEVHDIGTGTGAQRGKDFYEDPSLLGKGGDVNRHVECTDCHNPHRVIKNRLFNDNPATPTAATHNHAAGHSNIASGVLKGSYGVEPVYGGVAFQSPAGSFDVKRGVGGVGAATAAGSTWVTREYQVCLKCHSTYAYTTPPLLTNTRGGGTPSATNGLLRFTDQAMEFQPPATHKGEVTTTNSGASTAYTTANHRSWHPVIDSTGRTLAVRQMTNANATSAWRAPWNATADVGAQTMYCTDCHGSNTAADTVAPTTGPWGPHGSTNNFLLKGEWSGTTGASASGTQTANALCFKCHNPTNYADRNGLGSVSNRTTGFFNSGKGNLHAYHVDKIGRIRCSWCHVAVPHGWKNKALLVNLNDVGPEGGLVAGTQVRNNSTAAYNNAPYYNNAVLKVRTFATSGNWSDTNCGSAGAPGNGVTGKSWMNGSTEQCVNMP